MNQPPDSPGSLQPAQSAGVAATTAPSLGQLTTQVRGEFELIGNIAQTIALTLESGQTLWASKGALISHGPGIEWQLKIPSAAVSRMLSGEGLAMTFITAQHPGAHVLLGAGSTGKVAVWDLAWGPVTCTKGAFVAALGDVKIEVTTAKRVGAALFGGAGLLLQKISGRGLVFIHGAGDFVIRDLAPGEPLTVSTGNLAAFASAVNYDIVGVGGCAKVLFGREGLFMSRLTGPGRVLLQTMKRLAGAQGPQG